MISVRQLSANVILQHRFLGVKNEREASVLARSRVSKKARPASPTVEMKFANFSKNKSFVFWRNRKENILLIAKK